MASVTSFIASRSQSARKYLPVSMFNDRQFNDDLEVHDGRMVGVKGQIVDYMVRMMTGAPKHKAFKIPLLGAQRVSEYSKAFDLIKLVNGLDDASIVAASQLVPYDVVVRRGPEYYNSYSHYSFNNQDIEDVRNMIIRTLKYFKESYQEIVETGFTFEGGYTDIVTSGDGDFLSTDTLWDLKTSKKELSTTDSFQLLIYYLLGLRSDHDIFDNIEYLGVFNPRLNKSYTVAVRDISLQIVSRVLLSIGHTDINRSSIALNFKKEHPTKYKKIVDELDPNIPWNLKDWVIFKNILPEEHIYLSKFSTEYNMVVPEVEKNPVTESDFDVHSYDDGIHNITKNDYWTFCKGKFTGGVPPRYSHTNNIYMLKKDDYVLFVSENYSDTLNIMNGGLLTKLDCSLEYYYDHLLDYVASIQGMFGEYFNIAMKISDEIKEVSKGRAFQSRTMDTNQMRQYVGRVHGLIIDIDYFNHIHADIINGSITFYSAENMGNRIEYSTMRAMLNVHVPEISSVYDEYISENKHSLLAQLDEGKNFMELDYDRAEHIDCELVDLNGIRNIKKEGVFSDDTTMYSNSLVMKKIQRVFSDNHVVIWNNALISKESIQIDS